MSSLQSREPGFNPSVEMADNHVYQVDKLCDALSELSRGISHRKKKYSQGDVKNMIILPLLELLEARLGSEGYTFSTECYINGSVDESANVRDRYDIQGTAKGKPVIIIETDTHRADQISKKVVSRLALNSDTELIYVSLIYPNTHVGKDSEKKECKKYITYIEALFRQLHYPEKTYISHWL